jgi:DNA helicase HerA-like ATPase
MVEMAMIAKVVEEQKELYLLAGMGNRHGLVAGATGTGKTVTLQVMAEAFSGIGVPVFAADVKGDLSGISQAGIRTNLIHLPAHSLSRTDSD